MSGLNMTTVGGWATVIAVAGGIYYISGRKERSKRPPTAKLASKANDLKKEVKKKAKKTAGQSDGDSENKSSSDKKPNKKNKKVTKPVTQAEASSYKLESNKGDRDEEVDNQEFARQMAKAKTGAIAAPKTKGDARQKSVKQNKAQEKLSIETSSDNVTAPSSANGGDADDDRSLVNSPELSATTVESPVNGGISDMLEKSASGPAILNITAPTNPLPAKKQKQQPAQESAETKKQRQNRQKAELKKLERQQEEVERQKRLEEQRRTARLAEGRAAKDGSTFMAARAPATSSWSAPKPAVNGAAPQAAPSVDLLDTVESPNVKPAAAPSAPVHSQGEEAGSNWQASLLSEEEQIRIMAENDNWMTVKGKEKKKGAKKAEQTNGNLTNGSSTDQKKDYGVPSKTTPSIPGQKYDTKLVYVDENKKVVEEERELEESEWEVS